MRVTLAAFSGWKRPAEAWNVTWVPSGSEGESRTVNEEMVAPSAGAEAGAAVNWMTLPGSAPTTRSSPAATAGTFCTAVTTALPTCCALSSSTERCR